MRKAKALLPRNSRSFNRVRDITPQLPRHHECGVFVEEILNSVTVVIQSAVRRYLVKQRLFALRQERASQCSGQPQLNAVTFGKKNQEPSAQASLRFATEEENEMLILAEIYERARADADNSNALSSNSCVSQYAKKFIHASV